jgi:hypothetical protein
MQKPWPMASSSISHESNIRTVTAVEHLRRMRGGSQAHLMRCSDGTLQVVKFRNNPQHMRILANEMLATRLANHVGLSVPNVVIVEVSDFLVQHSLDLTMQLSGKTIVCESGLQFGSQYVVAPLEGQVFDYLPAEMLGRVRNLETFAGILALDKWTGNADGRQATFHRKMRDHRYTAAFIDQGYCFNAGEWSFKDHALLGVYPQNEVYAGVIGWNSFEPWLSRIEQIDEHVVCAIASGVPPAWYGSDWTALEKLVEQLLQRRGTVLIKGLIDAFRVSLRQPFPNWKSTPPCG